MIRNPLISVAWFWLILLMLLAGCATPTKKFSDPGFVCDGSKAKQPEPPPPLKSSPELVDLQKVIPGIVLDIRYATTNNFTGQKLYPVARCCLRREAAENLKAAQQELRGLGLALKIFDGYRPLAVQKKMWAIMPNEDYVANPAKGSRHNRGAAVDLTLIKLDGTELLMPTPFDDFTEKAHRDYTNLPPAVIENRALLQRVMEAHNFIGLKTEWWHFDYKDWRQYDLLDVDYSQIK